MMRWPFRYFDRSFGIEDHLDIYLPELPWFRADANANY